MSTSNPRINKFLSAAGFCSRRKGDALVSAGRVAINGTPAEMGSRVADGDVVTVDGEVVQLPQEDFVYIALHKPVGIVCTTDTRRERDNIIDFVGHEKRIFPIGRLDKPSEGLILLTNDGDIVNRILRARNHHDKEYVVTVDKKITPDFLERMARGVPILDTVTRPCRIARIDKTTFRIILTQGLNRQIRRMCEALGYRVRRLQRVRIMNIHLDLPVGAWRDLTASELAELRRLTADSHKTTDHPNAAPTTNGHPEG